MKIQNLTSSRSGRAVANQFVAYDNQMTYFQSYNSLIAIIDGAKREITIGAHWNYSVTTLKYFYQFMREYAPVVNFEWCRISVERMLERGSFGDRLGNTWSIKYESCLS